MNADSESRLRGLVLSCEHASAQIPARWRRRLRIPEARLRTHAAYDPGALEIARFLSTALRAPLLAGGCSRLLVDLNRPERAAFKGSPLDAATREELLRAIHRPHWNLVRAAIAAQPKGAVLHLGCHSFTPVLRGQRRDFELGLLYDPRRASERAFVARWQAALRAELPQLRVRRNAPYRGSSPGLTTSLRAELPGARYLGIELECNQRLWRGSPRVWRRLLLGLRRSLATACTGSGLAGGGASARIATGPSGRS